MVDKHKIFMNIANEISKLSKCVSHQVGCVFVKDFRILSMGYNGTPAGYKNCNEIFPNYNKENDREKHKHFSDLYEVHSEQNALIWAARNGISIEGCTVYCTVQPCWNCLKILIGAGVKKIYFGSYYDRINSDNNWWEFAKDNNVEIYKI